MPTDLKIGIIGGSGMEDPAFINDYSSNWYQVASSHF